MEKTNECSFLNDLLSVNDDFHDSIEMRKESHFRIVSKNKVYSKTKNLIIHDKNKNYLAKCESLKEKLQKDEKHKAKVDIEYPKLRVGDKFPLRFLEVKQKVFDFTSFDFNLLSFIHFEEHAGWNVNDPVLSCVIANLMELKNIAYKSVNFYIADHDEVLQKVLQDEENLWNIKVMGLSCYRKEYIQLQKIFNFQFKKGNNFLILYDKNYNIIFKDYSSNSSVEQINEVFYNAIISIKNPVPMKAKTQPIIPQIKNAQNCISPEEVGIYKELKTLVQDLTRKNIKETYKANLQSVLIDFKFLTTYSKQDGEFSKNYFKPILNCNKFAMINKFSGGFIDHIRGMYKKVINFENKHSQGVKRSIESVFDFLSTNILRPLNCPNMLHRFSKIEYSGIDVNYIYFELKNKDLYKDVMNFEGYYNYIVPSSTDFYLKYSKDEMLKNFEWGTVYSDNLAENFKFNYFDENMNEHYFELIKDQNNLIFVNYIVAEHSFDCSFYLFPLLEALKKNYDFYVNIYFITVVNSKDIIPMSIENKAFVEFKEFSKLPDSHFLFITLSEWTDISPLCCMEGMNGIFFDRYGKKKELLILNMFYNFDYQIKPMLIENKVYTVDKETFGKLKDYSRKLLKIKLPQLNYTPKLYVQLNKSSEVNVSKNEKSNIEYTAQFFLEARKKDRHLLNPFLEKLKGILQLNEEEELKILQELHECYSLKVGSECNKCKEEVGFKIPHYYCHWCKIYFCKNCGEKYNTNEDDELKRIPHEHFLVYMDVVDESAMQDLEEFRLGSNTFHQFRTKGNLSSLYCCTTCKRSVEESLRFVCISCRPGPLCRLADNNSLGFCEICENCFKLHQSKEILNNPKYMTELENENHNINTHVFLRVEVQCGNYYMI